MAPLEATLGGSMVCDRGNRVDGGGYQLAQLKQRVVLMAQENVRPHGRLVAVAGGVLSSRMPDEQPPMVVIGGQGAADQVGGNSARTTKDRSTARPVTTISAGRRRWLLSEVLLPAGEDFDVIAVFCADEFAKALVQIRGRRDFIAAHAARCSHDAIVEYVGS